MQLDRKFHFLVLLETRSTDLTNLLDQLPGIGCFSFDAEDGGRKGQGIGILFHSTIKEKVILWRKHVAWVRCDRSIWGRSKDVFLGGCYIPPHSSDPGSRLLREEEIEGAFSSLNNDVLEIYSAGGTPVLGGDFNSLIGAGSEFAHAEFLGILGCFPELSQPRELCSSKRRKRAGELLLDLAVSSGLLICTTGRGRGDKGQATCRGSTRTEHCLMDPDIYGLLREVSVIPHVGISGAGHTESIPVSRVSDHLPISFIFRAGDLGASEGLHGQGHGCGDECRRRTREEWRMVWREDKAEIYGRILEEEGWAGGRIPQIYEAINKGDLEGAEVGIRSLVVEAARGAGMMKPWRCPYQRREGGARRPVWFDQVCKQSQAALRQALRSPCSHAYKERFKEHRRLVRRV